MEDFLLYRITNLAAMATVSSPCPNKESLPQPWSYLSYVAE